MVLSSKSPFRILLVAPPSIPCLEIETKLQARGGYSITCIDTTDALEEFIATTFADIIILDQQWVDQIPFIKANQNVNLHVVTLTSPDSDAIQKALDLGADDCLTHPINTDLLVQRITQIASSYQHKLAEAFQSIAQVLSRSLELEDVLTNILDQVQKIVHADTSSIMMIEGDNVHILKHQSYGDYHIDPALTERKWSLDEAINLHQIVQTKTPLLLNDTHKSDLWVIFNEKSAWIRCAVGIPLLYGDQVVGILNVDSATPNHFKPSQIDVLLAFADYASIALQNALLYQQVQQHAEQLEQQVTDRTDELTKERNLLRTLIDAIPDNIHVKDKQGHFIVTNHAFREDFKTRYSGKEISGRINADFILPTSGKKQLHEEQFIYQTGEPIINRNLQIALPHSDDSTSEARRWISYTKVPLRDEQGDIIGIITINRDITHQKHTENALEAERTLLRTVVDNIPDSIYVKDTEGYFMLSNQTSLNNLGVESLEDLTGKTDFDLLPEKLALTARASEREIIATGEPMVNKEYTYDGQTWSLITKVPLRDEAENIIGIVGINRDITQIKLVEHALEAERTLLRTVIDNIPDNIYVKNLDHKFILANTATLNAHNAISVEELRNKSDIDFLPPHIAQDNIASEKHIMSNRQPYLNREYQTEDGRWLLISKSPLFDAQGNVIGLVGINRDITSIKDAEERITHIVDAAHCLLWYANVQHIPYGDYKWDFFVPNEKMAQDFLPLDIVPNERYANAFRQAISPDDFNQMVKNNVDALESDREGYSNDFRVTRSDGEVRWLHEEVRLNKTSEGIWRAVGVVTDITHHIDLETTLQTTNERLEERSQELDRERAQLQAIMDAMIEGVVFFDMDNNVHYVNTALTELIGYTEEDWGRNDANLLINHLPPERQQAITGQIYKDLNADKVWHEEVLLKHKDGTLFDGYVVGAWVKDAEGIPIGTVFVLQDISQRKRLELQKSRFIAHASHELRTPIANLKTRLYLIDKNPNNTAKHLEVIKTVTSWMHRLVDDLLDVSRFENGRITLKKKPMTVQEILQEVVHVQQEEAIQKQIAFSVNIPPSSLKVNVDYVRMVQVMTNLIGNAIRYTDPQGQIEVRISNDDHHAIIEVEDTGQGIAEEILPQVFDPFFRGSEYNVGSTGLGLSIAKEIIDLHDGEISVESEIGKGTCFSVKLALLSNPQNKIASSSA